MGGVIYKETSEISPYRKIIEKLFAIRQQNKDEHNLLMQNLVKLMMNSLYGIHMCEDKIKFYICKTEHWMKTEFDENVLDYWKLPNGNYIIKLKQDDGLEIDYDLKKKHVD